MNNNTNVIFRLAVNRVQIRAGASAGFGVGLMLLLCGQSSMAQSARQSTSGAVLDIGVRLQKTIGLYAENGVTAQFTNRHLAAGRLFLGASYVTSRLGTALGSNAIKQDNVLGSVAYYFRPNWLVRPLVKANVGYFSAAFDGPIFDQLPHKSLLASPELGLCYCPSFPLKITGSIGYNLVTGNGLTGPGTLYPVFVQTSITWNLLRSSHP